VNADGLLLGLLVLAYVGSILAGNRTIHGFGLPSGAEYLLLGFVLGPHVLGVVNRSLLDNFRPVLIVGAAWIALVAGIGYDRVGQRRVRPLRTLSGIVMSTAVGAGVAASVYFALELTDQLGGFDRLLFALSVGAVSCETTRHAVRWVVERHGAKGPFSDALADLSRASSLVPAAALAVLFASQPLRGLPDLGILPRVGITLGIGCLLGLVAALLLGREFRRDESWGILLGTSLLGMGVAERLGLSGVATSFAMGLTVALVSQHGAELKAMVTPTERPVALPIAVFAGAFVDIHAAPFIPIIIAVAVVCRLVLELVRGALLSAFLRAPSASVPALGFGMASTGALSLAAALAIATRFHETIGASALVVAAAFVLVGELVGPLSLRRALERVREISDDSLTPPPPGVEVTRPEGKPS
jgi:hypothetical protein